jgi:hypothetical protein
LTREDIKPGGEKTQSFFKESAGAIVLDLQPAPRLDPDKVRARRIRPSHAGLYDPDATARFPA